MMEVLLVRHGAASWDVATDMERVLTERGREEVAAAAEWLREEGWQPEQVWVSPYRRAQQSAEILNVWAVPQRNVACLTPDNRPEDLENLLATFTGQRLMLVGHNPLLSNAIAHWQGELRSYWGLQTASMALLEGEVFASGCAELKWLRHYPNYVHNGR